MLRHDHEEQNILMNIANCHEYSIFRFVTFSFFDKNKLIISHATSVATDLLVGGEEEKRKAPKETAGSFALYISSPLRCVCVCEWD